jgi:hypothetical protein
MEARDIFEKALNSQGLRTDFKGDTVSCSRRKWEGYVYCMGDWDVEFIIPCDAFDLSKEDQRAKCFSLSNIHMVTGRRQMYRIIKEMAAEHQ